MRGEVLKRAEQYQQQNKDKGVAKRPVFHLSSPVGWINDPNGFSVFDEEYHLFYQYHPYSTNWGPMHWGHSKTEDFIKWELLPVALAPEETYDAAGCFSGSAVEADGQHIVMYTAVEEKKQEDGSNQVLQTQCIAIGDGISYEKLEQNPVIDKTQLPKGSSTQDFRDPKMWKEGDEFFSVVANRSEDGSGQILLFSSKDLKSWEYASTLQKCNREYGLMWECPDFFPLDETHVLLLSPQDMVAQGLEFHSGNGTMSIIGDFNKSTYEFVGEEPKAIDYGLDFYAPQTLLAKDGRRIMIGWMQSWDTNMRPQDASWSGMMTVPRELSIKNNRLIQVPVRELEQYYTDTVSYSDVTGDEVVLDQVNGRVLDMTIEIEAGDYESFCICLAANETYRTTVEYNPKDNVITFDRASSDRRDRIHERKVSVADKQGAIKIRVLLDCYSVELFINDGEQAITSLILTEQEAQDIIFKSVGTPIYSVVKHSIQV